MHAPLPLAATVFILGLLTGAIVTGLAAPGQVAPRRFEQDNALPARVTGSSLAADVLRVIDGDTFEARVHVWPGIDITTRIRLRGIDAPELKARCRDEGLKAEAARDELQSILSQGNVFVVRISPDKYGGRVVADAAARGTADVSAAMLERGHARAYNGGRRESWCDG